jgi:two-component system response regulator HydG
MAFLTFFKDKQELIRYVIRTESTTVGRSSTNDICLPDSNVSRTHFIVTCKDGKFILTDKSTNGTFIRDKRVVSQELKNGDRILLGDWEVGFAMEPEEEDLTVIEKTGDRDPTQILNYDPDKRELKSQKTFIKLSGKKGKTYSITKDIFSIGKAAGNDLVLSDDEFVSNYHCKIECRKGSFFIKDLKSTNGTFLNNQQIIEATLPFGAIFKVGQTDIEFGTLDSKEKIDPIQESLFEGMIGRTVAMREVFGLISRIAKCDATVLIEGETGVGKELVARAVHQKSGRAKAPFVAVNCAAISKDLVESELFGHEKGAFTSAHQKRHGAFEAANNGTLFLDEIGELPSDLQPKLLRVLENREIKRVGSNALIDIDVRVVAATNRSLAELVRSGKFREDLFHRLYIIPIQIPPLRERTQDIPLLVEEFVRQASSKKNAPHRIDDAAMKKLVSFEWPGNVRELKNVISRAVLSCTGDTIMPEDISFAPAALNERTLFQSKEKEQGLEGKTLREMEKDKILTELRRHEWNKKKTAEILGISKTTLFEKIRKYDLNEIEEKEKG